MIRKNKISFGIYVDTLEKDVWAITPSLFISNDESFQIGIAFLRWIISFEMYYEK